MSDPANRLPPEYDETLPADYDPQFTASISTQMRVPDRIAVASSDEEEDMDGYKAYRQSEELHRVAAMNIPDKIIMNDEGSTGVRDTRMNLHLDLLSSLPATSQEYVGLDTPPRVLTLDERPFPGYRAGAGDNPRREEEEEDDEFLEVQQQQNKLVASLRNGYVTRTPVKQTSEDQQAALLATPGEGLLIQDEEDDDLTQLKRQVAKLHRHVQRLESESSSRKIRELFLYPLVAGYILLQFMKFLK